MSEAAIRCDPLARKIGKMADAMQCPRCKSLRIQLGYKDKSIIARLAGGDEFLCNNCGLEFKGVDSSGKVKRRPAAEPEIAANRRRAPRYKARLPVMVSPAERDSVTGKLVLSKSSRGHCVTISRFGMALFFSGARFEPREFVKKGRLLFVTITLPSGPVDAVITTVGHERVDTEKAAPNWVVQASITQMSESDTARLSGYLERRGNEPPLFTRE
jgi:hypothetical protein